MGRHDARGRQSLGRLRGESLIGLGQVVRCKLASKAKDEGVHSALVGQRRWISEESGMEAGPRLGGASRPGFNGGLGKGYRTQLI
ncbi:MAG: hypothetical protein ACI8TQ_004135 [Planctomycetota bacterium]|jgi:hypothetical protein